MRNIWLLPLALIITLVAFGEPALAQSSATTNPYDVSWSALDPSNDWAATVIRSLFPIGGTTASPGVSPGSETTVIQSIVGQLTGFIGAIACAFVAYTLIMHIQRAAESSRVLGQGQSWMFVVRVGFAGIMMFPLGGGFSAGQALVMQAALTGVGMARAVYQNAIQAVGPDAAVIAMPIIPGTRSIVAGIIDSELCMDLVNLAGNIGSTTPLVAAPQGVVVQGLGPAMPSYTTFQYSLSTGDGWGNPTCGTIKIAQPQSNEQTIAGVTIDMASAQQTVLTNVVGQIRPAVLQVAQDLWQHRTAAALVPLQGIYTNGVSAYTSGLTTQATQIQQRLQAAVQNSGTVNQMRNGTNDQSQAQIQQAALGWTGAGAYYLRIAALNGATLSLMNSTPTVTAPTFDGLGRGISNDLAPVETAARQFMETLGYLVQTTDGTATPSGSPNSMDDPKGGPMGTGLLDQIFGQLNLTNALFTQISGYILPTTAIWTDPFGGLMTLGQTLMNASLGAMAAAGILASGTTSTGAAVFQFLTGNWGGAAATIAGHALMSFFGAPIFAGLLALLVPGIFIAYVLPMIPYVMWIAGVCGWIILVCEAMIAVPLWMLAHMTLGGDGLHGRATEGWALIFNVVFRPTLMVIGLFMGYFVFDCTSWLIRQTFGVAVGFVLHNGWLVTNFIGLAVLLNIFVMTQVTAALMSFRLVALLPHHLPRLIGFSSAGRVDMNDFTQRAAFAPGQQTAEGSRGIVRSSFSTFGTSMGTLPGRAAGRIAGPTQQAEATGAGDNMDSTLQATTGTPPDTNGENDV